MHDSCQVINRHEIEVDDTLSYEEFPEVIVDRHICTLRNKEISSVKVMWRNHLMEEDTWKSEKDMREKYPYLFEDSGT